MISYRYNKRQKIVCLFFVLIPFLALGQSHNHWTRSFNEESSLLSGAVVGGGSGPAAIYYNPSSIAEINESKFSLHASLFSYNFWEVQNALGDGIDLNFSRGIIEPRFISYMIKPKNHPEWSLEIAFLNNENYHLEVTQSVDKNMDILEELPGDERYYSFFQYSNSYRDDWLGIGGSLKLSPKFYIGTSMFISVKSLDYRYALEIEAFPLDSVFINNQYVPFYSANYLKMDYISYNDYRLLFKIGLLYKTDRFSIGINFTTPSIGGIYSDGKIVTRNEKQSNITLETGEPLPDYVLVEYKEKNDVFVNSKSPLSVAAGFTYYTADGSKVFYSTIEYFDGLDPYRLVEANENPDLAAGSIFEEIVFNEWLTYISGAKPVLNAAVGYSWNVKENILLMAGFRTDFNFRKNLNYNPYLENMSIKGFDLNVYHITAGLSWRILGQDLITGLQYSFGRDKNQEQWANLSDPSEFNTNELVPLQGTLENNMNTGYNSISIYFGATFNFGGGNNK